MFQGAAATLIETIIFTTSDYRISNYNLNFSLSLSSSRGETKKLQDSIFPIVMSEQSTHLTLGTLGQIHKEF